jgi:hypothetical protein
MNEDDPQLPPEASGPKPLEYWHSTGPAPLRSSLVLACLLGTGIFAGILTVAIGSVIYIMMPDGNHGITRLLHLMGAGWGILGICWLACVGYVARGYRFLSVEHHRAGPYILLGMLIGCGIGCLGNCVIYQ